MSQKLLRFADLKERGIVNNHPTMIRWVERLGFPPGRWLGPNTRVWTTDEIDTWLANRPTEYTGQRKRGRPRRTDASQQEAS